MKSLSEGLPPEVAQQIDPAWRKNEADYWAVRDQLLGPYQNQWIGFANGQVLAAGRSPVDVLHDALALDPHPFFTCVGREREPFRMRRQAFPFDATYVGPALPVIDVEFRNQAGRPGPVLSGVIPDTGSDASTLPVTDCPHVGIQPGQGVPSQMSGVGATATATMLFAMWVYLDGATYRCSLHIDFAGTERILGRDVLNQLEVLFRGPSGEVVINP